MVHNLNLSGFMNRVTGSFMFLGHTSCLMLSWLGIWGWGLLPAYITILFPAFALSVASLIVLTATVQSRIAIKSAELIGLVGRMAPSILVRKEVRALRPLVFRSGSWFIIERVSPGAFLVTLYENLATLILMF